jgi:hypothetical protein
MRGRGGAAGIEPNLAGVDPCLGGVVGQCRDRVIGAPGPVRAVADGEVQIQTRVAQREQQRHASSCQDESAIPPGPDLVLKQEQLLGAPWKASGRAAPTRESPAHPGMGHGLRGPGVHGTADEARCRHVQRGAMQRSAAGGQQGNGDQRDACPEGIQADERHQWPGLEALVGRHFWIESNSASMRNGLFRRKRAPQSWARSR